MNYSNTFYQYDTVRFSDKYAMEMDGNHELVRVPISDINHIELAYKSGSERPILTGIFGTILFLFSIIFPISYFLSVMTYGGSFLLSSITIIFFAPLGAWMIIFSLRKKWLLLLHTIHGKRRLIFRRSKDVEAMENFINEVRNRFAFQEKNL